jgi:CSLREA domain-containing protein
VIGRILIMAWVWVVAPLRAYGATFVVDNAADEVDATPGDGVCGGPRGACTLRAAIVEANHLPGTDRVELPPGVFRLQRSGAGENGEDLDVVDDLVLEGAGRTDTVIHAANDHRVLRVDAGRLDVSRLTIRRGDAGGDDGGCVFALAPTAWRDVQWMDCRAANGAALWTEADVDVEDSIVYNSSATNEGGAFWLGGSATLRRVETRFTSAASGGALVHAPGDVTTEILAEDVWLLEATSTDRFGSAFVSSGGATVLRGGIKSSASSIGYLVDGDLTMVDSRIRNVGDRGCAVEGNGDSHIENVHIAHVSSGVCLRGVATAHEISGLTVVHSDGDGVSVDDGRSVTINELTVDVASVALSVRSDAATISGVNATRITGYAFALGHGTMSIQDAVFDLVESATVYDGTFEFRDVQISGHDGWDAALDVDEDAVVTIEDGAFFDNQNTDCWYCYADFGGAIENRGDLTLVRTTFDGNAASTGGGAILNTGALHIVDSTFVNNIADAGAALYNRAPGFVTVDGSVFEANEAIDGLVMYFEGGTLEVDDSAFVDNHASTFAYEGAGGAIAGYLDGYLRNTTVAGNTVGEHGSALALDGPGTLLLDAVTIAFNRANGDDDRYGYGGGALWIGDDHIVRMRGSILGNNRGGAGDLSQCAVEGSGSLVSAGDNLVEVDCGGVFEASGTDLYGTFAAPLDPRLLAPDLGGGPTPVVALLADSPAIDAGDACPPSDQWDTPRPVDGDGDGVAVCDIGAWEYP